MRCDSNSTCESSSTNSSPGGGLWSLPTWGSPGGSLLREGRAMVEAVARDFAMLDGVDVSLMWDSRIDVPHKIKNDSNQFAIVDSESSETQAFNALAEDCDTTLVIAPEIDGLLAKRCEAVAAAGKLFGSNLEFTRLASDKLSMASALERSNVPTPQSIPSSELFREANIFDFPVVLKPRFGAGSMSICRIDSKPKLDQAVNSIDGGDDLIVQPFIVGRPASVAVIRGSSSHVVLAPCWQHFLDSHRFEYIGGELISDARTIDRLTHLANRAIENIDCAMGYFGIDVVMGDRPESDTVIEINPRLTTSYIGLRKAYPTNLADVMLRLHKGESVELPEPDRTIRFTPDAC